MLRRLITAAAFLLVVPPITADTLLLRDGQSLAGKITGETAESVTIDTSTGRFTFPRSNIVRATKESPIENQKRQLQRYLAEGKIDTALHLYSDPDLQASLPASALNQLFLESLNSTANAVTATSQTAAQLTARFLAAPDTPPELLIFAAALSMDFQASSQAAPLLRRVEQNPPIALNWPAATVSGLLDRIASSAIRTQDGTILALSASLAAHLPLPPSSTTTQLGSYSAIEALVRKKDYLEASALFRPEMFLHRADLFIPLGERLVTAILAAPATESSLASLESARATVMPYISKEVQLTALKQLITRLIDSGKLEDAQRIADETAAQNADTGATLQHLLEFRQRLGSIDPKDSLARYKLAAWARSMGLLPEAKSLFLELRPDPRFSETVNLQITLIENAQAASSYAHLRTLFDRNDFGQLKLDAAEFLRTTPPEKFQRDTKALLQLAEFQKWSAQKSASGQAEAEFQQAERLAQRGEYDAALLQLNRLQLDRQDTAAAQKAQNLRDRIMREKIRTANRQTTAPTQN